MYTCCIYHIFIYIIYFETFLAHTRRGWWPVESASAFCKLWSPWYGILRSPKALHVRAFLAEKWSEEIGILQTQKSWIKGVQNTFHCMSDLIYSCSSKFYIIVSCGGITIASAFWSWKLQTGLKVWNHQNTMMFPAANLYPSFNHHGSAKWVPFVVVTFQLLSCSTSSVRERVILYLMSLAT